MNRKLRLAALAIAVFTGTVGIAAAQNWGYYDRDDDRGYRYERYDRDDFGRGVQVARSIGFEDGEQTAREDIWHRKPFNPYPRGHNHADRGYARDFGLSAGLQQRFPPRPVLPVSARRWGKGVALVSSGPFLFSESFWNYSGERVSWIAIFSPS